MVWVTCFVVPFYIFLWIWNRFLKPWYEHYFPPPAIEEKEKDKDPSKQDEVIQSEKTPPSKADGLFCTLQNKDKWE